MVARTLGPRLLVILFGLFVLALAGCSGGERDSGSEVTNTQPPERTLAPGTEDIAIGMDERALGRAEFEQPHRLLDELADHAMDMETVEEQGEEGVSESDEFHIGFRRRASLGPAQAGGLYLSTPAEGGEGTSGDEPGAEANDGKEKSPAHKLPPPQRVAKRPEWAKVLVPGPDGHLIPLELEALTARIEIEGPRARVLLDHVFRNPHPRQLEGTFLFPLPEGASVTYFSMFQGEGIEPAVGPEPATPEHVALPSFADQPFGTPPAALFDEARKPKSTPDEPHGGPSRWGTLREARIVEARRARRVYEEIVRRSIDPALLEWAGGQNFQGRVFPIPANGVKRVVLAFERTLPVVDGQVQLHVPLPDTKLAQLDVDLMIREEDVAEDHLNLAVPHRTTDGVRAYHYELRDTAPEVDVAYRYRAPTFPFEAGIGPDRQVLVGRRAGAPEDELPYFFARVRPEIPSVAQRFANRAVFLLDTSLSEEPERFERYRKLMLTILERDAGLEAFDVLSFDFGAQWLAPDGFLKNDAEQRARLATWLDAVVLEGATHFESAAARFAEATFLGTEPVDVFLLSDGVVSWGESEPHALLARFQQASAPLRFYGYRLGSGSIDSNLFETFVREGGAIFDARSEDDLDAVALAHTRQPLRLREVRLSGVGQSEPFKSPHGEEPRFSDMILEGNPRSLYPGQELRIAGRIDGTGLAHLTLVVEGGASPLIPLQFGPRSDAALAARAYGELKVQDLESRRHQGGLDRLITAYAQRFSVSCRQASFLVLESDADHVRYDVDEEEAAASDPNLMAALADWRRNTQEAIDFDVAPEAFERSATYTALEIIAGLRRGEPLAGLQPALERLRAMIRSDGNVRQGNETLLAQALACEALARAAARDGAWIESARSVLDDLVANQLDDGAFALAANRPPHAVVTAFACRALQAARRAGIEGTFSALHRLDGFLKQASLEDDDAAFETAVLALLHARPGIDANARSRARDSLLSYLENLASEASPEQQIHVLTLAWDILAGDLAVTRREAIAARVIQPLIDRFTGTDGATENAPDSSYARWVRAFLFTPAASFVEAERTFADRAGRDPAALFLNVPDVLENQTSTFAEAARSDSLSADEWHAYRNARAEHPDDPELYARWARKRLERGDVAGALRTLSSIVERHARDSRALRLVGYFLLEWNRPDLARPIFATVLEDRPFEPHAYRDLAKVEQRLGHALPAAVHYETILDGHWHTRFGSMKLIVKDEYARMLHGTVAKDASLGSELRERFGERMEGLGAKALGRADLRVTIAWNTDATDIDLWVTEPNGEKCFYSHKETSNGGVLLEDLTQGYGPERYELREAKPGSYLVQAHYYAQNPNALGGITFVTATITKHAGTEREETVETTVLLRNHDEVATLAKFAW
ncbi:MAG: hypothetical protein H6834_14415 [Planctomycetes bacterium]|nr:hypothetical protein [Planctomycetota bacterium]MCB9891923.1 hypothetical protein [Planctomycetota bacterium]